MQKKPIEMKSIENGVFFGWFQNAIENKYEIRASYWKIKKPYN